MKRRRSRGLGSSAAEHAERAHSFTTRAVNAAHDAQRNAESGSCRVALADLLEANRHFGAATQEFLGAQDRAKNKTRASGEFLDSTTRAHTAFLRFCTKG